jgi:hypothetical protein
VVYRRGGLKVKSASGAPAIGRGSLSRMTRTECVPSRLVVALAVGGLILAGCGGSTKTARSAIASSGPRPAPGLIPPGSVAVAAGTPITRANFDHWLRVAAKGQTSPGQQAIVPSDPPAFKRCAAQVRREEPALGNASAQQLRADCAQLFRSLSSEVMDFLIRSYWYEAYGARLQLVPTSSEIEHAYDAEKARTFPTTSGFRTFLAQSGETVADVRFRVLVNEIAKRLMAREEGSQTARSAAVQAKLKRAFLAGTRCEALVTMADCGNYRSSG